MPIQPGHSFNVPKHLSIPDGATHYDDRACACFFKIEGKRRWAWKSGECIEIFATKNRGWGSAEPYPIEDLPIPKHPKRIRTVFGMGTYLRSDGNITLVDLDDSPFRYRPQAITEKDIVFSGKRFA